MGVMVSHACIQQTYKARYAGSIRKNDSCSKPHIAQFLTDTAHRKPKGAHLVRSKQNQLNINDPYFIIYHIKQTAVSRSIDAAGGPLTGFKS